jgi:hypothetical protein
VRLLRGLVLGLVTFVTFFVIIALLVVPLGIVAAFIAATGTALTTQVIFLTLTRRSESAERNVALYAGPSK